MNSFVICLTAGCVAALGFFCRVTYLFFVVPLPLYVLHVCGFSVFSFGIILPDFLAKFLVLNFTIRNIKKVVLWASFAIVSFCACAFCIITLDSWYFGHLEKVYLQLLLHLL